MLRRVKKTLLICRTSAARRRSVGYPVRWRRPHLIVAGFGAALLTGLYLWRRDLAANRIAHFRSDASAFLIG